LRAGFTAQGCWFTKRKKGILAKMITFEKSKLLAQADGEIKLSAEIFDYYTKMKKDFW